MIGTIWSNVGILILLLGRNGSTPLKIKLALTEVEDMHLCRGAVPLLQLYPGETGTGTEGHAHTRMIRVVLLFTSAPTWKQLRSPYS